jgi:hypothetical protein
MHSQGLLARGHHSGISQGARPILSDLPPMGEADDRRIRRDAKPSVIRSMTTHRRSSSSMSSTSRGILVASLVVLTMIPRPTQAGIAAATSREECKANWDSMEAFSFLCDGYLIDAQDRPISGKAVWRSQLARDGGGRWALTVSQIRGGEPEVISSFREDGRRRFVVHYMDGNRDWISRISIQAQTSTTDLYSGIMFDVMWLLMPDGRPPYTRFAADSKPEEGLEDGRRIVTLASSHKGLPLRLVFDPARDWLVRRIELGEFGNPMWATWEVTRFERSNGRWFPVEGRVLSPSEHGPVRKGFKLSNLSINEPLDPGQFEMPKPPEGVEVSDKTTNVATIKGGPAAQKRRLQQFRAKYPRPIEPTPISGGPLIVASRDLEQFPWSATLLITSALVLSVGVGLRILRSAA